MWLESRLTLSHAAHIELNDEWVFVYILLALVCNLTVPAVSCELIIFPTLFPSRKRTLAASEVDGSDALWCCG